METIKYTISTNGITPASPQFAGVQGSDGVFEIEFDVTSIDTTGAIYSVEVTDGAGAYSLFEDLPVDSKKIKFVLQDVISNAGGTAQLYLRCTTLDGENNEIETFISKPARIYFTPSAIGTNGYGLERRGIIGTLKNIIQAIGSKDDSANKNGTIFEKLAYIFNTRWIKEEDLDSNFSDELERKANKTNTINENSTNTQYASGSAVYEVKYNLEDKISEAEGITQANLDMSDFPNIKVNYIYKDNGFSTNSVDVIATVGNVYGKWYVAINLDSNQLVLTKTEPKNIGFPPVYELTIVSTGSGISIENIIAYPLKQKDVADTVSKLIEQDSAMQAAISDLNERTATLYVLESVDGDWNTLENTETFNEFLNDTGKKQLQVVDDYNTYQVFKIEESGNEMRLHYSIEDYNADSITLCSRYVCFYNTGDFANESQRAIITDLSTEISELNSKINTNTSNIATLGTNKVNKTDITNSVNATSPNPNKVVGEQGVVEYAQPKEKTAQHIEKIVVGYTSVTSGTFTEGVTYAKRDNVTDTWTDMVAGTDYTVGDNIASWIASNGNKKVASYSTAPVVTVERNSTPSGTAYNWDYGLVRCSAPAFSSAVTPSLSNSYYVAFVGVGAWISSTTVRNAFKTSATTANIARIRKENGYWNAESVDSDGAKYGGTGVTNITAQPIIGSIRISTEYASYASTGFPLKTVFDIYAC